MPQVVCPICRKRFAAEASEAMPFCSKRCRQIDLGRWASETYSVPTTRPDDEADEAPPEDDAS